MTTTWVGIVVSFLLLSAVFALPALAQLATPPKLPPPDLPWAKDLALFAGTQPELLTGGVMALTPHVAAYEAALANGRQFFPDGATLDHRKYVMADGPTENLLVVLSAAAKHDSAPGAVVAVTAVANPYPLIGLQLGSYYNEIGKPEDAIRVLDEALSLSPSPDGAVGAHVGDLMSEKGAALDMLKRYSQALDIFDQALASHVLTAHDRARLDRGRGFALTELNRLDDAEAAFRDSLQQEPGNQRAQAELGYIARLRKGGPKAPPEMFSSPSQQLQSPQLSH